MMDISIVDYLIVSAILFTIGAAGVLFRKNAIVIFMCVELMLNAVNLTLVAFAQYLGNTEGQVLVFFVMTVAAAEAAVGLAIVIAMYRNKEVIEVDKLDLLRG
jgi:NADH-quinone oxidoreductase subunit K